MKPAQHAITRVKFETVLERRDRVTLLQDRISAFANRILQDALTEGLSSFGESQQKSVFLEVELDLGEISFEYLERDLETGIIRELRAWALRKAPWPGHGEHAAHALPSEPSVPSPSGPEIESKPALSSHLHDQASHRPSPEDHDASLVKGLDALGHNASANPVLDLEERRRWLIALRNSPALRERLAAELTPQRLPAILQAWTPEHSKAVVQFAALLSRLRNDLSIGHAGREALERQLLSCILDEAAAYRPGLSLRDLLHRIVARLARYHSLPDRDLARQIGSAWRRRPGFALVSRRLAQILQEFGTSADSDDTALAPPNPAMQRDIQKEGSGLFAPAYSAPWMHTPPEPLANLARFLEWGALPWSGPSTWTENAESELLSTLASSPDQVCDLIRSLGEMAPVRKRIALQFSETAVQRLIGELDPVNATWMLTCTKQLRLLHRQKPLIPIPNAAFGQLLSELTLEYLSERHWHALDAVSFLRFLLRRLANRQRVGHEFLLADLALRRSPESSHVHPSGEIDPQSQLSATIVTLLDIDLLGIRNRLALAPRFAVRPEFRYLYCDLDVLAYWLRWRILPAWSLDDRPTEAVRKLEPLLQTLPPDCVAEARTAKEVSAGNVALRQSLPPVPRDLAPALQIERWLLFGLWPAKIQAPSDAALERWLQDQSDADWLYALERCGAQHGAIHRMARLSFTSVVRIASLLSGSQSESIREFFLAVQSIGRPLEGSFPPPWEAHLNRCTLALLLGDTPAEDRSPAFVRQFAHNALLALSLSLQIPYERLLLLLRRHCPGSSPLHNLCAVLEEDLEDAQEPEIVSAQSESESAGANSAKVEPVEAARMYLLGRQFPSGPPALSFAAMQRVARRLSSSDLQSIAEACIHAAGRRSEILSRAERLLPPSRFQRLKQLASSAAQALETQTLLEASADTRQSRRDLPEPGLHPKPHIATEPHTGPESSTNPEPRNTPEPPSPAIHANPAADASLATEKASLLTKFEALTFFLSRGVIPWWGDQELTVPSSQWIEPLLQKSPDDLLHTLRSVARSPHSIERLLRYVPRRSLAKLIRHAEPASGATIILFLSDGEKLAGDSELTPAQQSCAAASHWRAAMQLILDEDQPRRSCADTLRYLSGRIAQLLGMATGRYLARLTKVAQDRAGDESGQTALAEILLQLRNAYSASEVAATSSHGHLNPEDGQSASPIEEAEERPASANPIPRNAGPSSKQRPFDSGAGAGEDVRSPLPREIDPQPRAQSTSSSSASVAPSTPVGEGRPHHQLAEANASGTDALTLAPPSPSYSETTSDDRPSRHPEPPATMGGNTAAVPIETVEEESLFLPNPTTHAGQLEHLLRFGALPESSPAKTLDAFMSSLAEAMERHPQHYRKRIERAARLALERRRMVQHFSAAALQAAWKLLLPTDHTVAKLCMEEVATAACQASVASRHQEIHRICAEVLLETSVLASGQQWEPATYLRRALLRLPKDHALATAEVVANLRSGLARQPEPLRSTLTAALQCAEREAARLPVKHRLPTRRLPEAKQPSTPLPEGEPFYIANAGTILLWPFLGRYFQTLRLMNKDAFLDDSARSRAIYLVQYLATGKTEAPEPALLLNKILCGAPPEQPVEAAPEVTEEEASLSAQLLQGVIANWGKLGNTSIDGLRASFLIREGRLLRVASSGSWSLTVSAKGYDLLLDSLPWRISMVRLPWMQTLLNTKWR